MKRVVVSVVALVVVFAVVLGVEIMLALTREYMPTEPVLVIEGTFGPPDGTPLTFVVLGDSSAAGVGAGSADNAYATLLAQRLADKGRRVELLGVGTSGARVADVLDEQIAMAVVTDPDLIFVGIGANDVTHVTPLRDVERDMRAVITALQATGAQVVVAGAPDMRAAAWYEPLRTLAGWRGGRVTAAIEAAARERGAIVVPLAKETAPYFAAHPDDAYSSDDFHPSPGGYGAWADAIYPRLEEALEDR